MEELFVAAQSCDAEGVDACSDESSRASPASLSPTPSTGNGTGVFIPACMLDGSAVTNPAIAAKLPRKQRRNSAQFSQEGDTRKQSNNTVNCSSPEANLALSQGAAMPASERPQERHHHTHTSRNTTKHPGAASQSTSAKNPFAATPKNIRQQQLLCNLMVAADHFGDPAAPGTSSRGPSLDFGSMPPPCPSSGAATAAGRASIDVASMSRVASRTSLDSCGWGHMKRGQSRNSCDVSNRQSMDSYAGMSLRTSMDRTSCYSGRPSVESSFSCYAPQGGTTSQLLAQQQQAAATAAAAAAAAAVAARASFEAALPPSSSGAALSRMGLWPQAGRASCELDPTAAQLALCRLYNMDSPEYQFAATAAVAAAAAASRTMQSRDEQQALGELLRYGSGTVPHVSSGVVDGSTAGHLSPSGAQDPSYASSWAATQSHLTQLQQVMEGLAVAQGASDTAAALASLAGSSPLTADTAALMHMKAQTSPMNGAANSNGNIMAPEAVLFQQQLQQIMQANQMASRVSAVQAAAASKLYGERAAAASLGHHPVHDSRWQPNDTQLINSTLGSLHSAMEGLQLQQQMELLQQMQL